MYILPYQYVLLIGLGAALLIKPKTPPRFTLFIAAYTLLEAANKILKKADEQEAALMTLNTLALGSVAYYLFVFLHASRKDWLRPVLALYAVTIVMSLFTQGLREMMSAAYIPGMLMTLAAILYYLYHLIVKSDYTPLARIPQFWMAIGIMIFFCCAFPMLVFGNALIKALPILASSLWPLVSYGNIFLALGFLAVSLCQMNTRTSS